LQAPRVAVPALNRSEQLHVCERRVCAALGQHRSTQRKIPRGRDEEDRLTPDIIELARQYGRYGYRKIAELLRPKRGLIRVTRRLRCQANGSPLQPDWDSFIISIVM
jgi:hypothetical protein